MVQRLTVETRDPEIRVLDSQHWPSFLIWLWCVCIPRMQSKDLPLPPHKK